MAPHLLRLFGLGQKSEPTLFGSCRVWPVYVEKEKKKTHARLRQLRVKTTQEWVVWFGGEPRVKIDGSDWLTDSFGLFLSSDDLWPPVTSSPNCELGNHAMAGSRGTRKPYCFSRGMKSPQGMTRVRTDATVFHALFGPGWDLFNPDPTLETWADISLSPTWAVRARSMLDPSKIYLGSSSSI